MHLWVAEVTGDRFRAVSALNGEQAFSSFVERLVPRNLTPGIAFAAHGTTQAVRVFVHVLDRQRLRTDVAAAERIGVIAAYRHDLAAPMADFDPAHRFAQVAGPVVYRDGV